MASGYLGTCFNKFALCGAFAFCGVIEFHSFRWLFFGIQFSFRPQHYDWIFMHMAADSIYLYYTQCPISDAIQTFYKILKYLVIKRIKTHPLSIFYVVFIILFYLFTTYFFFMKNFDGRRATSQLK